MRRKIIIIGGILIAVGLFAGFGWHFLGDRIGSAGESSGNVVYVSTVSSLTETASGVQNRYAGVVEPQETVEVKLESNRVVKDVKVSVGQEIAAGTPLFEYDASASRDELEQAQLELEQLQNDVLSLQEQLSTLEKEKKTAGEDNQLSYTIQIQRTKMDIKKNEYSQKSKSKEIEKLQSSAANTVITSEIAGVVKSIDTSQLEDGTGSVAEDLSSGTGKEGAAFITILGTGTYRVKGTVNEQNMQSIIEGSPVIIRSRVDSSVTWKGTMGMVDMENPISNNNNMNYYGGSGGEEEQTISSSYPFYVNLESADGLMLGQHVYIEMDYGQEEQKDGLWLDSFYIVDPETDPYVWKSDERDRLVKQAVTLGEYDAELGKYEITDGLTKEDCIAFPTEALEEGLETEINDSAQIPYTGGAESSDESMDETLEAVPEEELDEDPVVEGPGEEAADENMTEEDLEAIEASPDGPFADVIVEDTTVQEGVGPE